MSGSKATNEYALGGLLSDRITSLHSSGFTVGHPADSTHASGDDPTKPYHCVNHNLVTYYWVAFKAAPGEMQIGTYEGTGYDTRDPVSPSLIFQPDYVLVMPGNGDRVFHRTKDMPTRKRDGASYDFLGNKFCTTGCAGGQAAISSIGANGFTVGTQREQEGNHLPLRRLEGGGGPDGSRQVLRDRQQSVGHRRVAARVRERDQGVDDDNLARNDDQREGGGDRHRRLVGRLLLLQHGQHAARCDEPDHGPVGEWVHGGHQLRREWGNQHTLLLRGLRRRQSPAAWLRTTARSARAAATGQGRSSSRTGPRR